MQISRNHSQGIEKSFRNVEPNLSYLGWSSLTNHHCQASYQSLNWIRARSLVTVPSRSGPLYESFKDSSVKNASLASYKTRSDQMDRIHSLRDKEILIASFMRRLSEARNPELQRFGHNSKNGQIYLFSWWNNHPFQTGCQLWISESEN